MAAFLLSYLRSYARLPVIGLGAGFVLILGTIVFSTNSLMACFSLEGLAIVVGGVIAVAFLSFEAADVRAALDAVVAMIREKGPQPEDTLHQDVLEIVAWAYLVKEQGMRRLETKLARIGIADSFVKYGLNMVVSDYSPAEVRVMMETAADAAHDRDMAPVEVLQTMTSHAPAFGMIGTLVGMVAMLCSLGDNVASLGTSLSVAFLSTLYGVISARVFYMPAAAKLRQGVAKRRFRNQLVTEGMVMLIENRAPMYINDHLNSFLRPERRDYIDQFKVVAPPSAEPRAVTHPHLKVVAA